jgi:anti-sigma regulatory factor (Ser/Thr protein kinase)
VADEALPTSAGQGDSEPFITAARDLTEIGRARRAIAAHLRHHGCPHIDGAVLVASELITNAVMHGNGADRIVLHCNQEFVRIAVRDSSAALPLVIHDNTRTGGRGLRIVEQLAIEWGITPTLAGKDVWAIILCTKL